jgi:hypothetical protein
MNEATKPKKTRAPRKPKAPKSPAILPFDQLLPDVTTTVDQQAAIQIARNILTLFQSPDDTVSERTKLSLMINDLSYDAQIFAAGYLGGAVEAMSLQKFVGGAS